MGLPWPYELMMCKLANIPLNNQIVPHINNLKGIIFQL
jgi:hypothetical protein